MTNLIRGSGPTKSLVVHQLGHTGLSSTYCTAGLLGPQLNGPEFGILSVKHHQLLAAGSCHERSRKRLFCKKHRVIQGMHTVPAWVLQCKTKGKREQSYFDVASMLELEHCIHNSVIRVFIVIAHEESAESRDYRQNISACFYFILSERH